MAANIFTEYEVQSFIGKFLYLTLHGYSSNLQFTSSNGNISVNIEANLGSAVFPPAQCETYQQNEKPSRRRRRRRREAFRANIDATTTSLSTEEISYDQAPNAAIEETTHSGDSSCESVDDLSVHEPAPPLPTLMKEPFSESVAGSALVHNEELSLLC